MLLRRCKSIRYTFSQYAIYRYPCMHAWMHAKWKQRLFVYSLVTSPRKNQIPTSVSAVGAPYPRSLGIATLHEMSSNIMFESPRDSE